MKRGRCLTESAARHEDHLIVVQLNQFINDTQAVSHDRNVVEARKVRHHLENGAAGVKYQRVAFTDERCGASCNPLFLFRINERFPVNRLVPSSRFSITPP